MTTALDDALDDIVAFALGRRRAARPLAAPGERVGIGVIGVGRWGEILARTFSGLREVEVAALTVRDAARRAELQAGFPGAALFGDAEALLSSPAVDAVVIATPQDSHHALARRALERGKHVLVEKPFTRTAAQADELIALATAANRILMVDHTWLFEEGARRLRALIAGGEHGTVVRYRGRIARPLASGGGGALAALGVHHVALLAALAGEAPVRVRAEAVLDGDG
ncbi:MAG TPA: Gfo/Idh/MocA family oxidoreductase, partial [Kofleriaceae bacterium]|nr:Gfo/Idh/MocA family oxidoreductase [Kofleriaceae bacterium]